jgi:hypothetical protein
VLLHTHRGPGGDAPASLAPGEGFIARA